MPNRTAPYIIFKCFVLLLHFLCRCEGSSAESIVRTIAKVTIFAYFF